MKKSQKYLQSAAVLLELEDFDSCASRAYFAMFYAAQAVLLANGNGVTSNHGVRSSFIAAFVDTGIFPPRAGEALEQAASLQEIGDYGGEFSVTQKQAEVLLQESEAFVNSIARMVTLYT